jgi:uncharacterized phage protein (TIGR02216 family)
MLMTISARSDVSQRFPWRELMALGFGRLRLDSAAFWAMTPRELAAAIEGLTGVWAAPPDRAALDALMRRFPDRT